MEEASGTDSDSDLNFPIWEYEGMHCVAFYYDTLGDSSTKKFWSYGGLENKHIRGIDFGYDLTYLLFGMD